MQSVAPAASCLTNAGEVQSHAVYPLASKVALNPPDGKDDASGSPLIYSFPEKLIKTLPFSIGATHYTHWFQPLTGAVEIDFNDLTESIPAYLCLICMPLMYSISEGIAVGVISYVIVNLVAGKAKKITPLMYVLALLFILKYIFL